jgi:RNA polymerase sigma-70 factor, ECF subfamily
MNGPSRPSLRPAIGIAAPGASEENRRRSRDSVVRGAMLVADADLQFDWLFADEFPAVMRAVYLIVHDLGRAEDITQDAFVQLLRHWKKVSRYDRPGAWVRRVAIRLAVEAARRERVRALLERNVEPPAIRGPVDVDVMRAVGQLPGMQRAAVVLCYFEDLPLSEIADILRCSDATVRVHLHRARKRLAELLGEVIEDVP